MTNLDLLQFCNEYLKVEKFSFDPSFNGLQVEGKEEIRTVATAVCASLDEIEFAKKLGVDALIVHHGLFWQGQDPKICASRYQRVKALIDSGINLYAYHLPLDAHEKIGNNVSLASLIQGKEISFIDDGSKVPLCVSCYLPSAQSLEIILHSLSSFENLGISRIETIISDSAKYRLSRREFAKIAICSGSGSSLLSDNTYPDFDILITGDLKEQTYHLAQDYGVAVFALGHHASENIGVMSLGKVIEATLQLNVKHICIDATESSKIIGTV